MVKMRIAISDGGGVVVCWLLNIPATCQWISEMDLPRQLYMLPHWDRSCRSNFPSQPITVYWHQADQCQCWPYNIRHLAGQSLEYQFWSPCYGLTWAKLQEEHGVWTQVYCSKGGRFTTRPPRLWWWGQEGPIPNRHYYRRKHETLTLSIVVSVVNISNSQTPSSKDWIENGWILVWKFKFWQFFWL